MYVENKMMIEVQTSRTLSDEYAAPFLMAMRSVPVERRGIPKVDFSSLFVAGAASNGLRRIRADLKYKPAFLF